MKSIANKPNDNEGMRRFPRVLQAKNLPTHREDDRQEDGTAVPIHRTYRKRQASHTTLIAKQRSRRKNG